MNPGRGEVVDLSAPEFRQSGIDPLGRIVGVLRIENEPCHPARYEDLRALRVTVVEESNQTMDMLCHLVSLKREVPEVAQYIARHTSLRGMSISTAVFSCAGIACL